ncbi:sensor domain-containing diguanylate cyclase [Stigmatella erecta]|uniref:diguanylate cyclase n=1 Tax=Stigmatella erecta TaxID=83460 RepID=A0A1I0A978_9BACT|nr:sensor domain-containing diguanylate cyclase [Stigmatella erecta]SES90240.1 diguanylate cyclase with GAF sensor [Stigmatella erecta]
MNALSAVPLMPKLVRHAIRSISLLAVFLVFLRLARGGFRGLDTLGWTDACLVLFLLLGLGVSAWRRLRRNALGSVIELRDDLELGGGLIATAFIVVAIGGAALFPLIYLLMAFLVAFLQRNAGLTLLGVALAFDALVTLGGPGSSNGAAFATHALFLSLFAGMYHVVLSARIAAARHAESGAVQKRIKEVEERARTFRLISSGTQESFSGMNQDEKWLVASVKEIEGAVGAALEVAETALRTHTCATFLLDSDDRGLKLHDCRSASDRVQRERFNAGEGIIGGVLKRRAPVRMNSLNGLKGITYYESAPAVQAVLAVPIIEAGGLVRGVLVADRVTNDPFSDQDERLLTTLAGEVLRAIEVERVMTYIRKSRDEKDRFFRAIEELNRAGNPEQVFIAVLESARQIASLDFCAVTLVSEVEGKRMHRVARMTGVTTGGKALEGQYFPDNNGLVANVVRYGAPLPGRDIKAMERQIVFDEETQIKGLGALKIFPLTAGDRILGTLVVGSRKKVLDPDVLRMLEVMAIQAAQAVLRAQLFEQMERMATTDGLTGLLNHRTFQSKADEHLAQARRYQRKLSLILTDIDHFKSVNDTYGHPTGDAVLRGVAKILREKARDTDIVARYGGEEFAIIMPETDAKGALVIAERIREAVKAEVFQTEMGPLKVTLSLGISTGPDHGYDKQHLIDLSDQCLYHAKRNGRNQSVTVAQMQGGRKLQVAEAG